MSNVKGYLQKPFDQSGIGGNSTGDINYIWGNWWTALLGVNDNSYLTKGWHNHQNNNVELGLYNVSFDDKVSGQRVNNINLTVYTDGPEGIYTNTAADGTIMYYAYMRGTNGIVYHVGLASKPGTYYGWDFVSHEIGKLCIVQNGHMGEVANGSTIEFAPNGGSKWTFFEATSDGHATPIKALEGKEVHAICEPIDNGIDWGVNHGYGLFSDILSRPLIKVYGDVPPSWGWAGNTANAGKYNDILRSMEWTIEGRRFITTDFVWQGVAGGGERFVMLEEKGVGGTYGLYAAEANATDRGYPRDNEIYFIQGTPHGGGSVIKKINSGTGTFPEFNVSGGGAKPTIEKWEWVPITALGKVTSSTTWQGGGLIDFRLHNIYFADGTQTSTGYINGPTTGGDYQDWRSKDFNQDGIAPNNSQLVLANSTPGKAANGAGGGPSIKFHIYMQWGNNNDWRWQGRGFDADGVSSLWWNDGFAGWQKHNGQNWEIFQYPTDRRSQLIDWWKQFGYWKKTIIKDEF